MKTGLGFHQGRNQELITGEATPSSGGGIGKLEIKWKNLEIQSWAILGLKSSQAKFFKVYIGA